MKKTFAWLLLAALLLTPAALAAPANLAVATTQMVEVDGRAVRFETYALLDENGFQTNYAKLRDVASVLNGTGAQFSVTWSAREGIGVTTGRSYTADGTEMRTPYSGDRACQRLAEATTVDGAARNIAAIRLYDDDGNGYTYYKLRDLGQYLGFQVDWSAARGVFVETNKLYGGISRAELEVLVGTWQGKLDLSGIMAGAAGQNRDLADYLRFNKAEAAAELVTDRAGHYALSLPAGELTAALEQVKADYLAGMLRYAEAQARKAGSTLDQTLEAAGRTREDLAAELEARFDEGMAAAKAAVLKKCNAEGMWQVERGAYRLTGGDGADLPCALSGRTALALTVDEGLTLRLTKN